MNDLTLALAYFGSYCFGIITVLFAIYYLLNKLDQKKATDDEMAMAAAVGVVKDAMPGSSILSYEKTS